MKKKAIAHNIFGALSNFIFLFLTSIVLLPYYFTFITISDYGIWLGGISFLSLVTVFEANISLILTQQLGDKLVNNKTTEFSKYLSAAMFFGLGISIFIITTTFFIKDILAIWVSPNKVANELFSDSFFLYSISLSLTVISGYLNSVSQVFLKTLYPPIFNLIASILGLIYTVLAIPSQGIFAIAAGNLIKSLVYTLLVSLYAIKILNVKDIPFSFDLRYLSKLIVNIGLPFISKVGMTLAVSIQNFIIATTISATATTIFDITKKLPSLTIMVINMIAVSTFTSFTLFYSENKNGGAIHEYAKNYFLLIQILLLVALSGIFLIGQDFITLWVGIDKFGGDFLLALICLTALADQLRMILSQQYYAVGKFNLTSITDTIFALSFLILAVLILPILGLNGIVIAGILANIFYFISCFFFEKRSEIDMIQYVISKKFLFNFLIILFVTSMAKSLKYVFSGSHLIVEIVNLLSIIVIGIIFFLKEKILFQFLILKFGKSSNL
jgi:O-antigen/teichoic acid export membrane protein